MPETAAIAIRNLTKHYLNKQGEVKTALDGINLTIPKGSFYGLLGPNGAGKSTLINILAGLTVKTGGTVYINGDNQDEDARKTRYHIGVVPQEILFDPFFTVEEILDYYAGFFGVPKKERRTHEILKALSLEDKAHRTPRQLSGGMKRRLLIAKALVHSPSILILDEPTAGVDVDLRLQLWDYVCELNRQGTTVLLTTHYLEEAQKLCDHIAIIHHGSIIANDTPEKMIKMIDRKQLILTFSEPLTALPDALLRHNPTHISDTMISIEYRTSETSIDELLHFTKETGLTIRDLSTKEPALEDIFRQLVSDKPIETQEVA